MQFVSKVRVVRIFTPCFNRKGNRNVWIQNLWGRAFLSGDRELYLLRNKGIWNIGKWRKMYNRASWRINGKAICWGTRLSMQQGKAFPDAPLWCRRGLSPVVVFRRKRKVAGQSLPLQTQTKNTERPTRNEYACEPSGTLGWEFDSPCKKVSRRTWFSRELRARSSAALTVHRTVIHYRSPSSPPANKQKTRNALMDIPCFLAGAEGKRVKNSW